MISDYNHGKGWRARQKLFRMSIQCIELTPSSFSVRQKQPRTILGRDSDSNYRQGKGWGEAQVHINRGHCKTKLLPRTIWKPSLIRDEEGELLLFLCDLSAFMGEFYSNLGDPNILTLWLIFLVPYYILDIMSLKVKSCELFHSDMKCTFGSVGCHFSQAGKTCKKYGWGFR